MRRGCEFPGLGGRRPILAECGGCCGRSEDEDDGVGDDEGSSQRHATHQVSPSPPPPPPTEPFIALVFSIAG